MNDFKGVVFLVAELGYPVLLCSSVSLLHSIQNPTILCYISGNHYSARIIIVAITTYKQELLSTMLWLESMFFWTFHVCFFFYKVMFPFHANAHKHYLGRIHSSGDGTYR